MDSDFSSGEAEVSPNTPPKDQVFDYIFNILLIGDSGVGKTDLIGRLCDEDFTTKFFATIGINMESHTMDLDGQKAKLQIWDPSGSDRFRTVITKYFHNATGIMFVYDVNYVKSFQSIKDWIDEIQVHPDLDVNVKKILIGNKCDVSRRAISTEEGEALASSCGMRFLETSTVTGHNVQRAFQTLCQDMKVNYTSLQSRPRMPSIPTEPLSPA